MKEGENEERDSKVELKEVKSTDNLTGYGLHYGQWFRSWCGINEGANES